MACTVLLEIQVKPDQVDTIKQVFKDILGDTRAYDGCQGVEVTQNNDDPTNIVLVEKWDTRAHYEKYFAWRQETGAIDALGDMLAAPPSLRYFDPVDA